MRSAILLGGARVVTFLMTAVGLGFDFSGTSLLGFSQDGLRIMIAIAFGGFVFLTGWREIELLLRSRPRIVWDGFSPEKSSAMKYDANGNGARRTAYFTRLTFKNKSTNPSGLESTAKAMTALLNIYDDKSRLIDSWEGRWANNDEPYDYPSKWIEDRLDLDANNQPAILDIGLRFEGESDFHGWNNQANPIDYGGFARKPIKSNQYRLQVILSASNMKEKNWWFDINIPGENQSDVSKQIEINPIKRPTIHKADFQN